jgi:hypothetical protein
MQDTEDIGHVLSELPSQIVGIGMFADAVSSPDPYQRKISIAHALLYGWIIFVRSERLAKMSELLDLEPYIGAPRQD